MSHLLWYNAFMLEQLPNDINSISVFLHNAGWSYGYCRVKEEEKDIWLIDAARGEIRFVVRHRTLKRGFMLIRNLVLEMN